MPVTILLRLGRFIHPELACRFRYVQPVDSALINKDGNLAGEVRLLLKMHPELGTPQAISALGGGTYLR